MRKLAYLLISLAVILAILTLLKTNLLASDGRKMQEMLTELRQREEEVGKLEEEIARTKSLLTVAARAEEMGFAGAKVKRVEESEHLAGLPRSPKATSQ
jgi:cell shape-determining protein MreC